MELKKKETIFVLRIINETLGREDLGGGLEVNG
jgi:hypothetical protein